MWNADVKVIVFDIGGTLMEYRGMPNVWTDYYQNAFEHVRQSLKLELRDEDITKSVELLKAFNPRIHYREIEYQPEQIFKSVTDHWNSEVPIDRIIFAFFESMHLSSYIYPETISELKRLKAHGIKIATFTDVATGMPDELHKSYFMVLQPYLDLYVSSLSCGYRKPNPKVLQDIAAFFGVSPNEMLMIGDEEKDIQTAKRFGCRSVLIDRHKTGRDCGQDYTIATLQEVDDIINNCQHAR